MVSKRVAVAMSGGVDSMVAAIILKESGWRVNGIYLKLYSHSDEPERITSLQNSCRQLGIPLQIFSLQKKFQRWIIDYFRDEYSRGRTPNPCTTCNQKIKFGLLLDKVRGIGANYLATGHYARIEYTKGKYHLLKGLDSGKDQSYFLYRLGQNELKHLLFPIGGLYKCEVREIAAPQGLSKSRPRESQDICFISDNNYRSFISKQNDGGEITDTEGNIVGRHNGLAMYTVGQRQGLRLSSEKRLYVLELDTEKNKVIVGTRDQLMKSRLIACNISWVSGSPPSEKDSITAKIRYGPEETNAVLRLSGNTVEVLFSKPQLAITPGQDIVFYRGSDVLGGGIIEKGLV